MHKLAGICHWNSLNSNDMLDSNKMFSATINFRTVFWIHYFIDRIAVLEQIEIFHSIIRFKQFINGWNIVQIPNQLRLTNSDIAEIPKTETRSIKHSSELTDSAKLMSVQAFYNFAEWNFI